MKMQRKLIHGLTIFALLISFLGSALFAPRQAVLAAPSQVLYHDVLTLSAADFYPMSTTGLGYKQEFQLDGRYLQARNNVQNFFAPVNLPDGAVITHLTFHYRQNIDALHSFFRLARVHDMASYDYLYSFLPKKATISPYYTLNSVDSSFISSNVVDNQNYAYVMWIGLDPSGASSFMYFCGASIEFDVPSGTGPSHSYSVAASVLRSHTQSYAYYNSLVYLQHISSPGANGWYYARLNLPQGAVITGLSLMYYCDPGASPAVSLQRTEYGLGDYKNVASLTGPTGNVGECVFSTSTVANDMKTVDNTAYGYYLVVTLPPPTVTNGLAVSRITVNYDSPAKYGDRGAVSVTAPAFVPYEDGYSYQDEGRYLMHFANTPANGAGANGWYMAPVTLPQHAILTGLSVHYYNSRATSNATISLQTSQMVGDYDNLLVNGAFSSSGFSQGNYNVSGLSPIDNIHHSYWVVFDIPVDTLTALPNPNQFAVQAVTFTYRMPQIFMPVLKK